MRCPAQRACLPFCVYCGDAGSRWRSDAGDAELARAWAVFSSGCSAELSDEALRAATEDFLRAFVTHHAAWVPVESATPPATSAAPAADRVILGCSAGHPSALLRALARAAEQAAGSLENGAIPGTDVRASCPAPSVTRARARVSDLHTVTCHTPITAVEHAVNVPVLQALTIVARSSHNRSLLLPLRAVTSLVRVLTAARTRLGLSGASVGYSSTSCALICIAATTASAALCSFLEAELRAEGRPLRLAALSDVPVVAAEGPPSACLALTACASGAAANEALQAGAAAVLAALAGLVRKARVDNVLHQVGDAPLEAPALRCLAALLVSAPVPAGAMLRESGSLEELLDCVGQAPPPGQSPACELRAQLTALEVVTAAVGADRESLRRAANIGMLARLGALLRWASVAFSPNAQTVPLPLPAGSMVPCPSLELVFSVLRVLCAGVAEEAGARRAVAERTLVTTALAALSSPTLDEPTKWPAVREHALRFFEGLVRVGPLAVAALRGAGTEEALFGAAVYFWNPGKDAADGAVAGCPPLVEAGRSALRFRAASLLRAIAAAPAWSCGGVRVDLGFEPELASLLRALEAACTAADEDALCVLARLLEDLAAFAPERVGAAAIAVAAPSALANIMTGFMHPASRGTVLDVREATAPRSAWLALQGAFAALLSCSDAVRCAAAATPAVAEALLAFAWCPPNGDAQRWAMQHLFALAKQPLSHVRTSTAGVRATSRCNKTALYSVLLAALPRARAENSVFLAVLLQLVRVAAGVSCSEQEALAMIGAHRSIMELLLEAHAASEPELCFVYSLGTLATLLAGCATAHEAFALDPGYASLSEMLTRHDTPAPTPALLQQLQCLACDLPGVLPSHALFADDSAEFDPASPTLRVAGALPVLLACLRRADSDAQHAGLAWLTTALNASAAAQCCAADAALPRAVLAWYGSVIEPDDNESPATTCTRAMLASVLCACHAVSAEDVRAAFVLLRRRSAQGRALLLHSMRGAAAAARDNPRAFFALPGGASLPGKGLHLTLPIRWSSGRSFTFFMWMRAQKFPAAGAVVLSLRAESGAGIVVSVDDGGAEVTVFTAGASSAPSTFAQARLSHPLQLMRWQSFALVLVAGGLGPLGGGERARLFVDGAEVATARLRLPHAIVGAPFTSGAVAADMLNSAWQAKPCFEGELAGPHLFDDALRPTTLAALHGRGPDAVLEVHAQATSSAAGAAELHEASSRCVLALSAAACSKAGPAPGAPRVLCYNIAPMHHLVASAGTPNAAAAAATAGASTAVCVFRGMREAFRALGGVAALLPLLDDTECEVVAAALLVAAEAIELTPTDYGLVAHALRRRGARVPCSQIVFDAAQLAADAAAPACAAAARALLVYDATMWTVCGSAETLAMHSALLASIAQTAQAEVRAVSPPARIFDSILALGASTVAVRTARQHLLIAGKALMLAPAGPEHALADITALISLLLDAPDAMCAADAAELLTELLTPCTANQDAHRDAHAAAAAELGGPALALHLVLRGSPDALPSAVRLVAALLATPLVPTAQREAGKMVLSALWQGLSSADMTAELCDVLLGLTLGRVQSSGEHLKGMSVCSSVPHIVHASAVALVLDRLLVCNDVPVCVATLEQLALLVDGSVANAASIVRQRSWQRPLLQMMCSYHEGDERVLVARKLLALLHAHCMLRYGGPGGGSELDRTASYTLLQAADRTLVTGAECDADSCCFGSESQRVMCQALTDALQLALQPGVRYGPSVAHNVAAALFLVDELLPASASLLPLSPAQRSAFEARPTPECVWQLGSVAARTLASLWPSLQAAAAAAAAALASANADALAAPSLRQRAISLLFWSGSYGVSDAANQAEAACAHAARITLRLCLMYAREAPIDVAQAELAVLMPLLLPASADGDRCQLFCSAVSEFHRHVSAAAVAQPAAAFVEREKLASALLLASAVAGGFVPAPADADVGPLEEGRCQVDSSAAQAVSAVLSDALSQSRISAASEAEVNAMRSLASSRCAAVSALRQELVTCATAEAAAAASANESSRAALAKVSCAERARRAASSAAFEENAVMQERKLRNSLRSVSGERGVWAPQTQPPAHWKMDKAEDSTRRRQRLRRDYRHATYADATSSSQPQDAGNEAQLAAAAKLAVEVGALRAADGNPEADCASAAEPLASAVESDDADDNLVSVTPRFVERDASAALALDDLLWSISATLVSVKCTLPGRLDIYRRHMHFEADFDAVAANDASDEPPAYSMRRKRREARRHWRWPCARLTAVHCQRYLLQTRALELFFDDRSSAFLALPSRAAAIRAAATLVRVRPGLPLLDRRRKTEAAASAAERWRRREMSNFEYLMTLNTLAGRSFNDLAQYPVLPWVIADYTSKRLDLGAPGALRDLSLPVGALNPARRSGLAERYAMLSAEGDADVPPFHHGSHYSTPGGVLHWLLRLQPFTAMHRSLQGGRFDHGDRLFHSVPAAWTGAWNNAADVRELTPEFFCMPEFLLNGEGHDLGTRQDGRSIGDVELPPWAQGDAAAFVRANAAALESEAVSASLDGWVDLIFGVAQRGSAAVERLNVFFHLTYEGAVDLERVADERSRMALADQIALFGQTPAQLFTRKHPTRSAPLWPPAALCGTIVGAPASAALSLLADVAALPVGPRASMLARGGTAVVFLCLSADGRVIAVGEDGEIRTHRLVRPSPAAGAFTFSAAAETNYCLIPDAGASSSGMTGQGGALSRSGALPPFAASVPLSPACFAALAGGRLMLSAAHWDARLRVLRLASGDDVCLLQALAAHADLITCVGAATSVCVTGSRDTTLCVWDLAVPLAAAAPPAVVGITASMALRAASIAAAAGVAAPIRATPRCSLPGHDAPVSCVGCSEELDLIVSGSAGDSTLMFHSLGSERFPESRYLRSIKLPAGATPTSVLLADCAGAVVLLLQPGTSGMHSELRSFNCNGRPLASVVADECVVAVTLTCDTRSVLTGGDRGTVVLRDAATLEERGRWSRPSAGAITSLCAAGDDAFLAGTRDGRLLLWAADGERRGARKPGSPAVKRT